MAPQPGTAHEESVTVDDCGKVSQDLSAILDVEPELLGGLDRAYTLEVSSPGLDRPLRDVRDYRRFAGRLAEHGGGGGGWSFATIARCRAR